MKPNLKLGVLFLVALAMTTCPFAASAGESEGVFTLFRVLVGTPASGEAGGGSVLIVPGTVVMLGRSAEEEAKDVLALMTKLKETYRLGDVSLAASLVKQVVPGTEVDLRVPGSDVAVGATLLGFDGTQASYAVRVAEEGEKPSQTKVLIARGSRGIVGSRDGAAAPYLFLTIEPMQPAPPVVEKEGGTGEIKAPEAVSKVRPVYPEQARKARISGIVILQCTVGADGTVQSITPLRSEPMGLTEAAEAAVRQWRYAPARNAAGQPVAVVFAVTVSFVLQ
jgi:TonB family protein